ncbi:hypothetical protein WJX81_006994 [Elliptochloris bilobata]|uniref:Uncharacterized protein n=1 Tax=Elliptochloris bilobata TaxID=381761 RepID=A0AAW1QWI2_9CHLO
MGRRGRGRGGQKGGQPKGGIKQAAEEREASRPVKMGHMETGAAPGLVPLGGTALTLNRKPDSVEKAETKLGGAQSGAEKHTAQVVTKLSKTNDKAEATSPGITARGDLIGAFKRMPEETTAAPESEAAAEPAPQLGLVSAAAVGAVCKEDTVATTASEAAAEPAPQPGLVPAAAIGAACEEETVAAPESEAATEPAPQPGLVHAAAISAVCEEETVATTASEAATEPAPQPGLVHAAAIGAVCEADLQLAVRLEDVDVVCMEDGVGQPERLNDHFLWPVGAYRCLLVIDLGCDSYPAAACDCLPPVCLARQGHLRRFMERIRSLVRDAEQLEAEQLEVGWLEAELRDPSASGAPGSPLAAPSLDTALHCSAPASSGRRFQENLERDMDWDVRGKDWGPDDFVITLKRVLGFLGDLRGEACAPDDSVITLTRAPARPGPYKVLVSMAVAGPHLGQWQPEQRSALFACAPQTTIAEITKEEEPSATDVTAAAVAAAVRAPLLLMAPEPLGAHDPPHPDPGPKATEKGAGGAIAGAVALAAGVAGHFSPFPVNKVLGAMRDGAILGSMAFSAAMSSPRMAAGAVGSGACVAAAYGFKKLAPARLLPTLRVAP